MDFGASFAKYVLFVFNILAMVCGILIIVFGSFLIADIGGIKSLAVDFHVSLVPIIIIVVGCIIAVISFVGCCGAIRQNVCLTMTYSVVMLVLFIVQIIIVVYIWCEKDSLKDAMNQIVKKAWIKRNEKEHYMDVFQITFNCCGQNGAQDYLLEKIPTSCCGLSGANCSIELAKPKPGCTLALRNFWTSHITIAQYAGLLIAGVELIAFIFACCIANQARNERRRSPYY